MDNTSEVDPDLPIIPVSIGLVINDSNQIFVTTRLYNNKDYVKAMEFPGGKIETSWNETPQEALNRELYEEINIETINSCLLETILYRYNDRVIELYVFKVTEWFGSIKCKEGQEGNWIDIENLDEAQFLEANSTIIYKLKNNLYV